MVTASVINHIRVDPHLTVWFRLSGRQHHGPIVGEFSRAGMSGPKGARHLGNTRLHKFDLWIIRLARFGTLFSSRDKILYPIYVSTGQ